MVKHKKLFAILTLVCFMFTLMPVAAFAEGETTVADILAGGEVTLNNNITTGSAIVITKNTTINLNEHTISSAAEFDGDSLIVVENGATLTVQGGGTIDSSVMVGIKMTAAGAPTEGTAKLIVKNATVEGKDYGISGNGNGGERDKSEVVIEDGAHIIGGTTGIFNPQAGKVTINGGTIEGATGIEMRGGELGVAHNSTAVIKGTAAAYSLTANNNGATTAGAGIALVPHNGKSINAGVYSGTITGPVGAVVTDTDGNTDGEATLTINGGTIHGEDYGLRVLDGADAYLIGANAKIESKDFGVYVRGLGGTDTEKTIFQVKDGATIEAEGTAIAGNGTKGEYGNTQIDIYGNVKGSLGVFHPQVGTLTIYEGANIEGATGIEMRAGTLTVNGGIITANGNFQTPSPNNNGSTADGVAVAVSQHTTEENINVTINGGTLNATGKDGYALYEFDTVGTENLSAGVAVKVSNGTFKGLVNSANNKLNITAGIFSAEPAVRDLNNEYIRVIGNDTNGYIVGLGVQGVTVDKQTLEVGDTAQATINVTPTGVAEHPVYQALIADGMLTVAYESNNTAVATVDANGVVTAVGADTATINAKLIITVGNSVSTSSGNTCTVTVTGGSSTEPEETKVTGVTLDKTTATLTEGESTTLTATVAPENATNKEVTWTSSDEEVATVANGVVTGVKAGTATITVTTVDGNFTATCTVTVSAAQEPTPDESDTPEDIAVESVTLDKSSITLKMGETETATLVATVTPADATNKNVTWASDNTSVATVDAAGKVTAVAKGTTNITVTTECGAKTATCVVTVESATTGGGGSYVPSAPSTSDKTESSTTTTTTPNGSTVETTTETKTESDGTKVETETTTTTTASGETTKVETTTETKTDGTTVETTTTTTASGETSTTVTATLENGSAVTNNDETVEVEVEAVEDAVVEAAEEAVEADENVAVVGTADNAVSVSATNAATGAAQTDFVQPMSVSVPVDNKVLNNVTDTSKLTLAKVVTNADGTTSLEYMGGSYDEETGTFNAKVDEDGDYILVEKADLVKIELTIDKTDVKHNDKDSKLDVAPQINKEAGRTELPLRYLGEALGFTIDWSDNNVVTITKGDVSFSLTIGQEIPGFGTPYIDSERTMVSARYISEKLGANVIWDPIARQVTVVK